MPNLSRLARPIALAALALSAVSFLPAASAQAATKVGVLECNVSGGVGFVITSSKGLSCVYRPSRGGRAEYYFGTIRKFGLDIGFTGPGRLAWAVIAPSQPGPRALAGDYVGASGSISIGAGVGANALVGGFRRSFTLQPLSIQAQTGVDLAAGVGAITLEPGAPPRRIRR